MKTIPFYKMSGSGNDFIIVDNRDRKVEEKTLHAMIVGACRRKMSVGADGFILVEESRNTDFRWRFYNADGSRAEMCGNGARCVCRFAFLTGIAEAKLSFESDVGVITAEILGSRVKIRMTDPRDLREGCSLLLENPLRYHFINTGVPHVVIETEDVDALDVPEIGRAVRYHAAFAPAGTNVNFIQITGKNTLTNRTYERGVENETLACGTGSAAAALIAARQKGFASPVTVLTRSGEYLRIFFKQSSGVFSDVYLEGDARVIYSGELWQEAWKP
jgi:diaminopimelate epimerase